MKLIVALIFFGSSLSAQIIVQSGLTHRLETMPGGSEVVPISLKNTGEQAMQCSLELSDIVSRCDSGYSYLPVGSTTESCAAWLQLEQEEFTIDPGEEKYVKVLFNSPADYHRAGARACVLVNSKPVMDSAVKNGLKVRVRYAISFLYRNPVIPGIVALHAQKLELHKERPFWMLSFQNLGNVDRIVRSHAKLLSSTGEIVYSQKCERPRGLIPNQCRTLRFPTPDIPAGTYQMVVLSETDEGEKFGVTQTIQWDD